jgi:hypothetical protein
MITLIQLRSAILVLMRFLVFGRIEKKPETISAGFLQVR